MSHKPTKADLQFAKELEQVKKKLHHRVGKEMCKQLHGDCFDCKTRILIAYINEWIDLLEWDM